MPEASPPVLEIVDLDLQLPSGDHLLTNASLSIHKGEVVALVGASGSGKSTFSRMLLAPEELSADGFSFSADKLEYSRRDLGLVPQLGAPFDHLSVAGNIRLALAAGQKKSDSAQVAEWLDRVGLPEDWAKGKRSVSTLSGGQRQRLAIARTLACGKNFLFLDEPSVGLDPKAVAELAKLLREYVHAVSGAAILVTHDVEFAVAAADRIIILDSQNQALRELQLPDDIESRWHSVHDALAHQQVASAKQSPKKRSTRLIELWAPFTAAHRAVASLLYLPTTAGVKAILGRAFTQALLRPLVFYFIVSTLIGYTVLFVMSKVGGAGVRADAILEQLGGSYAVALTPPLSAMLFAAISAGATNAWLGSMQLTKQVTALKALGIDDSRYLVGPIWLSLGLSYLVIAAVFAIGLIVGGSVLAWQIGVESPLSLLSADFLSPSPGRSHNLRRCIVLVMIYAWGLASSGVGLGLLPKRNADDVTRTMTKNVVSSTLWIVGAELVTARLLLPV